MSDLQTLSIKFEVDDAEATAKIAALQEQADHLLATLEKCKGACAGCQLNVAASLTGKDLVAVLRGANYRELRTK